ncbi:MAG TPA: autotransporter-associated beta strand repeat-containing protein [Stellaceae bacterium]|nr:autotransporter-associated beta strand repeat-containing protein [Stellaceae bacterium]
MPVQKKLYRSSSSALRRNLLLSTALTGVMLAATGQPARAANQIVNSTGDSPPPPGSTTLRSAIAASTFVDTITTSVSGTITLMSNLPPVTGQTIDLSAGTLVVAGPFGVSFNSGSSSLTSPAMNTYSGASALVTGGNLAVVGAAGYSAPQSQLEVDAASTFTANTTPTMGVAPGATFASLTGAGTINLGAGSGNGLDLSGNDQLSTIFSGNIIGAAGELALFGGGGTLTLSGTNNTYSGPTDIFGNVIVGTPGGGPLGATLIAGAANVFSHNSPVVMMGGASSILNLNNNDQTIASLAGSGIVQLGSALLTLGGDNTTTIFTGGITGTGGIDKIGTGTFTLTNSGGALQATFSGPTLIDGGKLLAGAVNSFSPNSAVAMAAGATLDLNSFNQTIAGLSGNGSVTLGSATLTINTPSATAPTFLGKISGTGGLTLSGAGTEVLVGLNNTFSGATTINGGTLQGGRSNVFSPNSAVTVAAGATLDLKGNSQTIAGLSGAGSVTLATPFLPTTRRHRRPSAG